MPLKTPSPVLFWAVLGISNNFCTNRSLFAVNYFWITLTSFWAALSVGFFHPSDCSLCDKLSGFEPSLMSFIYCSLWLLKLVTVEMCPVTWFSGSLEVSTVGTCTVPTSTESITTAWTLSVTTRWAWVFYHFFEQRPNTYSTLCPVYCASDSQFRFSHNEKDKTL